MEHSHLVSLIMHKLRAAAAAATYYLNRVNYLNVAA